MRRTDRGLWIALGVLVLIVLAGRALGTGMMMGRGMDGWYGAHPFAGGGWMWGLGMGLGWLGMLAFWGALIALAVLLFRRYAGPAPDGEPGESVREILDRRFAAGEITREQYEEMRQTLAHQT